MSEHVCIVVLGQDLKRFELCRALRHVPGCKGADVALRFDRFLDGEQPLAFGYEALCHTADSCLTCMALARVTYALFTTTRGAWMDVARDVYVRAFYNDAALVFADKPLDAWTQDDHDVLIRAKAAEAEAAWG